MAGNQWMTWTLTWKFPTKNQKTTRDARGTPAGGAEAVEKEVLDTSRNVNLIALLPLL
ncbi:FAD-dependent oxidoreductase family protein [Corchorus olitorius]|uniref:FAD-dependent oxidoreductase family protein n=1 Tax=Corchorus olitorius TaxID=93759 RepID=A0A1R3J5H8_9ROSI|nr:FAD-dependent oxidoreductase family protein [Corchorus olitorius]